MPDSTLSAGHPGPRPVRDVADAYVIALADLNPMLATRLGLNPGDDRLPDASPAGQQARDDLARSALADLEAAERLAAVTALAASPGRPALAGDGVPAPGADGDERRCGRLLRERLTAGLAVSAAGEHLREVSNIFGPVQQVRGIFLLMPAATEDDWAVIARRMARVSQSLAGYRESLAEGARRGMLAAPRLVCTVAGQLDEWAAVAGGRGWFAD